MKKLILLFLIAAMILSAFTFTACMNNALTLYVTDDYSALSVANIINDGNIGGESRQAKKVKTVVSEEADVIAKCTAGEADMAVLPTNIAVKICSGSKSDYVLFSVNAYGALYIVGTEELTEFTQLKGKNMLGIGESAAPETVLKKVCSAQKVSYRNSSSTSSTYLSVKYYNASEIITQLVQGNADFALLDAPAVTQCAAQMEQNGKTLYTLFDMQQLWQSAVEGSGNGFPQTSMIVRKGVFSKFSQQLKASLDANAKYLNEHAKDLKTVLQSAGSTLTTDFTKEIVARCNIRNVAATDARSDLDLYLDVFGGMSGLLPLDDKIFGI